MKKKRLHLELMRFIAIMLVIFNHTGQRGYLYFTGIPESPGYFICFLLSALCKIAVPLFWMVSGALLLDRQESIKELFRKRFLRILIVLTVFSLGYYLYSAKGNPDFVFSPFYFVTLLYSSDLAPAFWYLYAYLGMLVLLPLLRRLANAMTNREYCFFFAAMLLLRGLLPVLEYTLWHGRVSMNPSFTANFFSYDLVFLLAGYFLEHRLSDSDLTWKTSLGLLTFGFVSIVIMMAGTQLYLNDGGTMLDTNAERFYAGLLLLPSGAVFYSLRCFTKKLDSDSFAGRLILLFGSVSFGVMLLEHFVRSETEFIYTALCRSLPDFAACLVWVSVIYLICALAVYLLRLIPAVRKYI